MPHARPTLSRTASALSFCAVLATTLTACSTTGGTVDATAGSGAEEGGGTGQDSGQDGGPGDGSGLGLRSAAPSSEPSSGVPDGPATLPTFDASSSVGSYAPTFPRDLLGAPEGATVLASSAAPGAGKLIDVSLSLSTERSAQDVVDQIAGPLHKAGFEESGTAAFSGLTAQTTFTHSKNDDDAATETVVLGVLDVGEKRLVTVSGSVLP